MVRLITLIAFLLVVVNAQVYTEPEYAQDNLYHDYAMRQQEKEARVTGGTPWGKIVFGYAIGWLCGAKYHSGKQKKKMNAKHKTDQKQLYTQYYNDVYSLREENAQLKNALEQLGYTIR